MILLRFSRGRGFADAFVRLATCSDHAEVGFRLENGLILDSTPKLGVALREPRDDETTKYFAPLAPKASVQTALSWALSKVGRPYDWRAIFCLNAHRKWQRDTGWFPPELVEAAFRKGQWPLLSDSNRSNCITPMDLYLSTRMEPMPTSRIVNG